MKSALTILLERKLPASLSIAFPTCPGHKRGGEAETAMAKVRGEVTYRDLFPRS